MNTNENKEEYINLLRANVKRDGIESLIEWLNKTDFFTAPASSKFHSACEGGLCRHSLNVYKRFVQNLKNEYGDCWSDKVSNETATICALLHDICKVDYYKLDYRNVKENGQWVQKEYYTVEDKLPYGHGEKSVYIINGFIRLSREEAMTINWHMGGFDMRVRGGSTALSDVFYSYPMAVLFHISDIEATYLDEEQ